MLFSGQLDEFIHDVTYLRGIFGYLNERKLSLCGAVVSLMGADENHKFIWPNCCGSLPVPQDVLLQIEFQSDNILQIHLLAKICRQLETWQNAFKAYSALDDLKI